MGRLYSFISKISALVILGLSVFSCSFVNGRESLYVEAESFTELGGWSMDPQFYDAMGSSYILAHGLGVPVDDAMTDISLPSAGEWYVYVRTYNWTSPWSAQRGPGKFRILVNGSEISGQTLGETQDHWDWEYAGSFQCTSKSNRIAIHDLTGFDGRVDAIYFSREKLTVPFRINTPKQKKINGGSYDLVVVGAGCAGICAAVAAARKGLKVALINDFSILGGNNSSLVRVHLGGRINVGRYPALGNLLREFAHTKGGNAQVAKNYEDSRKLEIIRNEKNITLFAPYHFCSAKTKGRKIKSVTVRHNMTGELLEIWSPLFADCTGDASMGFSAGADYSYGRESRQEYSEPSAPEKPDRQTLGASIQWYAENTADSTEFPEFSYGVEFTDSTTEKVTRGDWQWETGMLSDMIYEAEKIRDYGMLVVYSNWSYLKGNIPSFSDKRLSWVSYVLGKRESRRLLGDIVLTENDIKNGIEYEDGTAATTWSIDLHYPDPRNTENFPGREFKSICTQEPVKAYEIPYRCLYSRNIENLLMAGRNISVSHIALGTTRVMRTTAMEGEVIGLAAAVCRKHGATPREVYTRHLGCLRKMMTEGAGNPDAPDTQHFNGG